MKKKHDIRFLLLGADDAGKTTLLYKYKTKEIVTAHKTIGFNVEFVLESFDKFKVGLSVWDVGGGEQIRPLTRHYLQNTQVVFLMFDVTSQRSFEVLDEFKQYLTVSPVLEKTQFYLIGNKADIKNRLITETQAKQKAHDYGYEYLEISAATDPLDKIDALFRDAAKKYVQTVLDPVKKRELVLSDEMTFEKAFDAIKGHLTEVANLDTLRFKVNKTPRLDMAVRKIANICKKQNLSAEQACKQIANIVDKHFVIDKADGVYFKIIEAIRKILAKVGLGPYKVGKLEHDKLYNNLRADVPMKIVVQRS